MNMHFKKKNILKFTWQHPGSKQWHCIDYVIMCQKQRRLCCDVGVVCCADCWTDHKLLCAKVRHCHASHQQARLDPGLLYVV